MLKDNSIAILPLAYPFTPKLEKYLHISEVVRIGKNHLSSE